MYNVQFLSVAKNDLLEIAGYIAGELKNPAAALRIAEHIVQAADNLSEFPYSYPVYVPVRPVKYEYRKMRVENYLVFYTVDEKAKNVTITRVIYAKRDFDRII